MRKEIPTGYTKRKWENARQVLAANLKGVYDCPMRLSKIRKAKGLTQSALAEMAGVEQPTISRIERGSKGVTLDVLSDIADALDVEIVEFFMSDRDVAERVLLRAFRQLPLDRQRGWIDMASTILADQTPPTE